MTEMKAKTEAEQREIDLRRMAQSDRITDHAFNVIENVLSGEGDPDMADLAIRWLDHCENSKTNWLCERQMNLNEQDFHMHHHEHVH